MPLSDRAKCFIRFLDNGISSLSFKHACSVLGMVPFEAVWDYKGWTSLCTVKPNDGPFFTRVSALNFRPQSTIDVSWDGPSLSDIYCFRWSLRAVGCFQVHQRECMLPRKWEEKLIQAYNWFENNLTIWVTL